MGIKIGAIRYITTGADLMITLNCFENFRCISSACTDSCCIGWEIYIDEETGKYYKELDGSFGERIRRNITDGEKSRFVTDEKGRCPFLNRDGLCDIILELGEDKIPYICKNHPRFYNENEMGMGIACEEAARLLLSEKNGVNPIFYDDSDILLRARNKCLEILTERSLSLPFRLKLFLDFSCEADELYFSGEEKELDELILSYRNDNFSAEKKDLIKEYALFMKTLESVGEKWDKYPRSVLTADLKREEFIKNAKWYKYENLAVYYVFRYFIKAYDDGDIISKVKLAVISTLFNMILDLTSYSLSGEPKTEENAVIFSRELEYSEENIEKIYGESCENELFSYDNLIEFINFWE